MLIVSLVLSILLLLTANLLAWAGRAGDKGTRGVVGVLLLGPLVLFSLAFPACLIQAVFLGSLGIFWSRRGWSLVRYFRLSCAATAAAYVLPVLAALGMEREYARLRVRYPYESMEARLAGAKPAAMVAPPSPDVLARLARLERNFGEEHSLGWYREYQLRMLHERSVDRFINSAGFGVGRMIRPSEAGLAAGLTREPVPPQPGAPLPSTSTWSPGRPTEPPEADRAPLGDLLETSILDFANARRFGYFKDRLHVAGFVTHRFQDVPRPVERWQVQRLELVSLLLHDEPAVYVSDRLPEMKRRGSAVPTRPLDRFEGYGLKALGQGDDLFVAPLDEGLRMLGAVRATNQCLGCHGCKRGELLGAFSYSLGRTEHEL
jgi:hypothetical protein